MVSIAIVSILVVLSVITLDPLKQLSKAKDSRRLSDITKIRNVSDIYYDDSSCYPTDMPFGGSLQSKDTQTTYLNPVPQDPDFSRDNTQRYIYESDGSDCSQWNVLFARLANRDSKAATTCPLSQMLNCLPPNFANSGYNYCVVSGTISDQACQYIASTVIPNLPTNYVSPTPVQTLPAATQTPGPTGNPGGGGATPSPTPPASPTPTPEPTPNCSPRLYACNPTSHTCDNASPDKAVYCDVPSCLAACAR